MGLAVDPGIVNHDLADVTPEIVAQGADDDIAFLIQQYRGLVLPGSRLDRIPQGHEVIQVPGQLLQFAVHTRRPDNGPHTVRDGQIREDALDFLPVLAFNAA